MYLYQLQNEAKIPIKGEVGTELGKILKFFFVQVSFASVALYGKSYEKQKQTSGQIFLKQSKNLQKPLIDQQGLRRCPLKKSYSTPHFL